MLDALVGAVIMVVATTSLLYSIEVAERAFEKAGRHELNPLERSLLDSLSINSGVRDEFWEVNIKDSWVQWGRGGQPE